MYNYNKPVLSPYDPTKLEIFSILRPEDDLLSYCGPNVKKTVSFDDVVHFIGEENFVTYVDFDCVIRFLPETPTKTRQINRERKCISRACENPQFIPSNDQHSCCVDEQHRSNIVLNPQNLWDTVPASLMSLNHTNDTYSMFNQYPQLTTQQCRNDSYPMFSSLRTIDTKRKGFRVSFAFFQKNYLPDRRVNETVAKFAEFSNLWKPGAMEGTPRLWWFVNVSRSSYLFHLFDFYCFLVQSLLFFFENLHFSFPFFDDFEWAVKVPWQLLCKVTLL